MNAKEIDIYFPQWSTAETCLYDPYQLWRHPTNVSDIDQKILLYFVKLNEVTRPVPLKTTKTWSHLNGFP